MTSTLISSFSSVPWGGVLAFVALIGGAYRTGLVIIKKIEKIAAQFSPNGGSSLRDSLDRIEKATAFGEKRSRALYDNGDESKGWFEIGRDGTCLHVSNSWCRIHHFQRDEALGQGWLNAVSERSRTLYVDAIQHAISDKRSYETEYVTTLDERIKLHADIVLSPTGDLLGFVGFVTVRPAPAKP